MSHESNKHIRRREEIDEPSGMHTTHDDELGFTKLLHCFAEIVSAARRKRR